MSHILSLIKKELRELLTPATILPIVIVALLFASLGGLTGGAVEDALTAPPKIAMVNMDDGDFSQIYLDVLADFDDPLVFYSSEESDIEAALAEMKAEGAMATIVIGSDYSSTIENGSRANITIYWNMVGAGMFSSMSTAPVDMMIINVSTQTTHKLIESGMPGEDSGIITSPISYESTTFLGDKELVGVGPAEVSAFLQGQSLMMPLLIMIVIVMLGGIIISSMGQEKENKTLETLLTLPVSRTTIVSGKLIGSAIVGLIFAGVYMLGMNYYMEGLMSMAQDMELAELKLGITETAIVGLMVALAILCALGLCMILGAFAKNYKAAQSLTIPISFLAVIPFFVVMFTDFVNLPLMAQVVLFIIPFTHPMMAMNNMIMGNYELVYYGIAYLVAFNLATVMVTVRLYKSDILLTGLATTLSGGPLGRLMRKR